MASNVLKPLSTNSWKIISLWAKVKCENCSGVHYLTQLVEQYTSYTLYYANGIRLHSFIYVMSPFFSEKYMLNCTIGPCFTMWRLPWDYIWPFEYKNEISRNKQWLDTHITVTHSVICLAVASHIVWFQQLTHIQPIVNKISHLSSICQPC